jgi:hypothetical protein
LPGLVGVQRQNRFRRHVARGSLSIEIEEHRRSAGVRVDPDQVDYVAPGEHRKRLGQRRVGVDRLRLRRLRVASGILLGLFLLGNLLVRVRFLPGFGVDRRDRHTHREQRREPDGRDSQEYPLALHGNTSSKLRCAARASKV